MVVSLERACFRLRPFLRAYRSRPVCSLSLKPQAPLFLRPPVYSATFSDLQKWHGWAKTLSSSVGSSFAEADNGPDSAILLRELQWLIDDAVPDQSVSSKLCIADNHHPICENVQLRISIEELYELWEQRIRKRRPFQYVVGCEHWRDLVLSVHEGVLIPRPETERLVDLVNEVILDDKALGEGLWADLGTGSGAIAIAISRILGPRAKVIATDLSSVALACAAFNVQRYELQEKIELRQGSWFKPLADLERQLCGLISNPPYIPRDGIAGLQAEVGRHEPKNALDGGADGMGDLLHLCNGVSSMLKPGGFFAFETNGELQCQTLVGVLETDEKRRFCRVRVVSDFAGIPRFITGFCQEQV